MDKKYQLKLDFSVQCNSFLYLLLPGFGFGCRKAFFLLHTWRDIKNLSFSSSKEKGCSVSQATKIVDREVTRVQWKGGRKPSEGELCHPFCQLLIIMSKSQLMLPSMSKVIAFPSLFTKTNSILLATYYHCCNEIGKREAYWTWYYHYYHPISISM